jgi:hypothetical protein
MRSWLYFVSFQLKHHPHQFDKHHSECNQVTQSSLRRPRARTYLVVFRLTMTSVYGEVHISSGP